MMTLANYGLRSSKPKDPNSAKSLSKSLQIRNRAELALQQCLRIHHRLPDDKRIDIISLLNEYYARVPLNVVIWNKFQTNQCLVDSIVMLDSSFNPYKARLAFKTIEDMLINLIYLPWHKEFTKICPYSGRFRYIVSNPLIGAEEVLKAAGFEQSSEAANMNLVLPDRGLPLNDELQSVVSVIFDCMLAQVVVSDVINVFESCCKSLRQSASELADGEINCYSWIQAYIRERSHQITDKARSGIQELLNNTSNHLTKNKIITAKVSSSSKNERSPGNTETIPTRNGLIDEKDKVSNQHNRRYFTDKTIEDSNALKISEDLLKIPDMKDHDTTNRRKNVTSLDDFKTTNSRNHSPAGTRNQPMLWGESELASSNQHYQQPSMMTRQGSRASNTLDMIDSHIRMDSPRGATFESNNQPIRVDRPHNDRELLIPKPDRKFVMHDSSQTKPCSPRQYYRSQISSYADDISQNSLSTAGRYQSSEHPMFNYEAQATSQQSQNMIKNSSSRYDSSSNRKYESRDIDRTTFNSRLNWSCNTCTYNNHPISEICEMCGKRRT